MHKYKAKKPQEKKMYPFEIYQILAHLMKWLEGIELKKEECNNNNKNEHLTPFETCI